MRRPLLPLLIALSAPGLAGCQIKQYPPDQVTRAQSPESVDFRDNDLPPAAPEKPRTLTIESGNSANLGESLKQLNRLNQTPQYFPPENLFPLQTPQLVVPKVVAPPTPEQVNAVSPDVVKFLQTGAFDPNVTPPTPPPPSVTIAAASANPLDGTVWVRETKGCRVVVKFAKDRLDAAVTAPNGVSLAVAADYALGRDGMLFGVVTAADAPEAEGQGLTAKLLAADGAPYCVRVRVEAGTLTVRDLRCGVAEGTYAVLGAYKKTTAADLAKLPPVAGNLPAELNRRDFPRPAVAPRSSLESAADFAKKFAAENPQLVQVAATELGKAVGGWVGDRAGRRRTGEAVGVAVGSAVAAKLTATPPADFRSVRALSYWLGATANADAPKP